MAEYGSYGAHYSTPQPKLERVPQHPGYLGGEGASQPDKSPSKKSAVQYSIIPTTVKQLSKAQHMGQDEGFQLNGQQLGTATLVGMVLDLKVLETNLSLKLDDGTGFLECRMWADQAKQPRLVEKQYVRVFGHVTQFHNSRSFVLYKVSPIEDFNELTFHFLNVIEVSLLLKRGPLSAKPAIAVSGGSMREKIINFLRQMGTREGVREAEIVHHLRDSDPAFNMAGFKLDLDYLQAEGHIYTTLDDHTFALTSN